MVRGWIALEEMAGSLKELPFDVGNLTLFRRKSERKRHERLFVRELSDGLA
jgi:hypothetical protein